MVMFLSWLRVHLTSATTRHALIGHRVFAFGTTHGVNSAAGTAAGARTAGEGKGSDNGEAQCGESGFKCRFHIVVHCSSLCPALRRPKRCAVHERVAFYRTAAADVFGASFFLSRQGAHLSWAHLSQQSPPCLQQVPQSLVAFIFGWSLSCANAEAAAKVNASKASFSVFMVLVFSLVAWWISGGVVPLV